MMFFTEELNHLSISTRSLSDELDELNDSYQEYSKKKTAVADAKVISSIDKKRQVVFYGDLGHDDMTDQEIFDSHSQLLDLVRQVEEVLADEHVALVKFSQLEEEFYIDVNSNQIGSELDIDWIISDVSDFRERFTELIMDINSILI